MDILITGGTGLIGRALCRHFDGLGHKVTVLSRRPDSVSRLCGESVAGMGTIDEWDTDRCFDVVINLAGEPIFDARWTEIRKKTLWDSRVTLTKRLVERMATCRKPPSVLVSGSAIGYYGNQGDAELVETNAPGKDFSAGMCEAWEQAALKAGRFGTRVCLVRTGLVLSSEGGLLGRMTPSFRFGLGARLGDGKQWMSWIHMDDYVRAVETIFLSPVAEGAFNLTGPCPVTNTDFTETLAQVLRRPAIFSVPAWLLEPILGEMAELLLGSQRVLPRKLEAMGFYFKQQGLKSALESLLVQVPTGH